MQHQGQPIPTSDAARGVKPPAEERIGVFRADSAVVGNLTPERIFVYKIKWKRDNEHMALPCGFIH